MNYSVHAVMYGYYYLMAVGAKPKWLKPQVGNDNTPHRTTPREEITRTHVPISDCIGKAKAPHTNKNNNPQPQPPDRRPPTLETKNYLPPTPSISTTPTPHPPRPSP